MLQSVLRRVARAVALIAVGAAASVTAHAQTRVVGEVLDELGERADGVHVRLRAADDSGFSRDATTAPELGFIFKDVPPGDYVVEVLAGGGWLGGDGVYVSIAAGEGVQRLRLGVEHAVSKTFIVEDELTHEAVTRFAVDFGAGDWFGWEWPAASATDLEREMADHPDGKFTAQVGADGVLVRIMAPGYLLYRARLGKGTERVSLSRGLRVSGCARIDGEPASGARVLWSARRWTPTADELANWFEQAFQVTEFEERDWWRDNWEYPQRESESGRVVCDADGRFEFSERRGSWLLVEVSTPDGHRLVVPPFEFVEAVDLGALALEAPGTIRGHVVTPLDESAQGWKVWLESSGPRRPGPRHATAVDEFGNFVFADCFRGQHWVHVEITSCPGYAIWPQRVDVAPGQVHDLEFDARESLLSYPSLVFRANDEPVVRAYVELLPREWGLPLTPLGFTSFEGRVQTWTPALGQARIRARTALGMPLALRTLSVPIHGCQSPEATIECHAGRLVVEWPPLPDDARPTAVTLSTSIAEPVLSKFEARIDPTVASCPGPGSLPTNHSGDFGMTAEGTFQWTLAVRGAGAQRRYRATLTVRAGETTTCVLTERERIE